MRWLLLIICFITVSCCNGQYYFNDILSIKSGNEQYLQLRKNKVRKIKAISFDADNSLTDGFFLEEDISLDGKKVVLHSILSGGRESVTNRYFEMGRLKRIQTFSNRIENRTDFSYSDNGLLQKLVLTTMDTVQKTGLTELHEWTFGEAKQPQSMLRIKNGSDTTLVSCKTDEDGLVIEEQWKKNGRTQETWYYYYNAKKQLTDIVRYNAKLKKLVPDFIYEYDANGRVSQMTQLSFGSGDYIIWKYVYNELGLKKTEAGFDKSKQLVGRIEYSYE